MRSSLSCSLIRSIRPTNCSITIRVDFCFGELRARPCSNIYGHALAGDWSSVNSLAASIERPKNARCRCLLYPDLTTMFFDSCSPRDSLHAATDTALWGHSGRGEESRMASRMPALRVGRVWHSSPPAALTTAAHRFSAVDAFLLSDLAPSQACQPPLSAPELSRWPPPGS